MTSDDLRLVVGNKTIEGWLSVEVVRGIERCPSEFALSLTERYPGEAAALSVRPGDACKVFLGKDLVVTGYVNRFAPTISAREHQIIVSGRGKCQDLVDCSAQWPGNQFSSASVYTIARGLASAYGITVEMQAQPTEIIPQLNISRGETPFEIIERICRYVAVLAYEGAAGQLIISGVGKSRQASGLQQGKNVEDAAALFADDLQFSQYDVYSSSFNMLKEAGEAGFLVHSVVNPNVKRVRRMDLIQEGGDPDAVVAKRRAQWECNRRFGRSNVIRVTTDTWRDKAGALYEPNKLVEVDIPALKVPKRQWVIGEVVYRRDARGTACDLTLMPPEAFDPQPINLYPVWKEVITGQGATGGR